MNQQQQQQQLSISLDSSTKNILSISTINQIIIDDDNDTINNIKIDNNLNEIDNDYRNRTLSLPNNIISLNNNNNNNIKFNNMIPISRNNVTTIESNLFPIEEQKEYGIDLDVLALSMKNKSLNSSPLDDTSKPSSKDNDNEEDKEKGDGDEEQGENLYSSKEVGWKGWRTVRLIGERYIFGFIVAFSTSILIYIMSLLRWSNGSTSPSDYLNESSYSIFFTISILLFGTIYVTLGFLVSYGYKTIKEANIMYYTTGVSSIFVVFYTLLHFYGVNYWYYYLDAVGVVAVFVVGEVLLSYRISCTLQKIRARHIIVVDRLKAMWVSFNYTAPDIVVTVMTVLYMFFLLPVYFSISNDIIRLGWRLIVHPIYWVSIVSIARLFLTKNIDTDDILLNTNIVLHTFFHHATLGRLFVYTFSNDTDSLTEIGMLVSAIEDTVVRCVALKRDEFVIRFFYGKEFAHQNVYSQQNLQLRAAILNIQVALEFSGLFSAPIFIYFFNQHATIFHFFDGGIVRPLTLFYQTVLSIVLDVLSELLCTYVECRYYRLPIKHTWKWMKANKPFLAWLCYGALTMGLLGMLWTCARVPRAGLCSSDDICTCGSIIASSLPPYCTNSTLPMKM